jgi:hypothetical protein
MSISKHKEEVELPAKVTPRAKSSLLASSIKISTPKFNLESTKVDESNIQLPSN